MKTRPISFIADMVRALLAGTKMQTRRPIRLPMTHGVLYRDAWRPFDPENIGDLQGMLASACPFGVPGDRLWVRETARVLAFDPSRRQVRVQYEADGAESDWLPFPDRLTNPGRGRCIANGVHREGARITLEVTEVRVQRFSDISEEDAKAEGVDPVRLAGGAVIQGGPVHKSHRHSFALLLTSIYGPDAWNSWCWAVSFRRVESAASP